MVKWKIFRFIGNSSPANVPIHDFIGKIPTFFEKVGKWKIFRFVGKSSLTANIPIDQILEEFPPFANVPIHLILLEKFPLSPFGLKIGTLTGPDKQSSGIFEKVGKWKIFRFTGKFSSTANIPIHQIFGRKSSDFSKLENCSPPFGLKLRTSLSPGK